MDTFALISLIITSLLILVLFLFIDRTKTKAQIKPIFLFTLTCLLICCIGLIMQIAFCSISDINPIYFDYFVYVGTCLLPVAFLLMSLTFANTKINYKKYWGLFVVPVISLILLWTNDLHHLFYKSYSTILSETVTGPWAMVHSAYSYVLIGISLFLLFKYSAKNSGFFSKQSVLIFIGAFVSAAINILGALNIIHMSIYATPISFSITVLFFALAIFKFDFLKVTPIALQRIVDRISDGYIIVNEENLITDFNQTFLDLFSLKASELRNLNFYDLLKQFSDSQEHNEAFISAINSTRTDNNTIKIERYFPKINKYFNIEINSITNKDSYLGTLVLLKDVTQHNIDMQTIKDNQEMLVEKERLATLGQMIGGIAHNLKTPIMSISGAAEGLSDLITEYEESVGDPEVTVEDHHEIAKDMKEWVSKIRTHLSYMSDIITAVKGQAVTFSDNSLNGFTVEELVRNVDILMRHELKNALINLVTDIDVDKDTSVGGNVNSLVQVVNNIISNAIQAYNGKQNENIFFNIYKEGKKLIIKIQDNAGGLPEKVKEKLFKEMITTKGKNGTGLGLFMSYSNIKAHFNGNMRFESVEGVGTAFYIELPLAE